MSERGPGRPPMLDEPARVTVMLDRTLARRLRVEAEEKGVSQASVIRQSLRRYLRQEEAAGNGRIDG